MSEDPKIVVTYSDIQKALKKDALEQLRGGAQGGAPRFGSAEVPAGLEESFPSRSSSIALVVAIVLVIVTTLAVVLIGMLLVISGGKSGERRTRGDDAGYSSDGSSFSAERWQVADAARTFRADILATESEIRKGFDYQYLKWTDETHVYSLVANYEDASSSVRKWCGELEAIEVNSEDYADVPKEVKSAFKNYREAAYELDGAFSSFSLDWARIDRSTLGTGAFSSGDSFLGNRSTDGEGENDASSESATFGQLRESYNKHLRKIVNCCSVCASERDEFIARCERY